MNKKSIIYFSIAALFAVAVFGYRYAKYVSCHDAIDFKINAVQYQVGEVIRYKDNTVGATKRMWDFGDGSGLIDSRIAPYHVYEYPGQYIVQLRVDDRCTSSQLITIGEKETRKIHRRPPCGYPISPPPAPPKTGATPVISRENFARKLMAVSKGKEKASDFNRYLCDNENTTTKINGSTRTFKYLCDKIKNKGILIQKLEFQKGGNNCISHIKIRFSSTNLFN